MKFLNKLYNSGICANERLHGYLEILNAEKEPRFKEVLVTIERFREKRF